jgi:hypothetical protein
VFAGSVLLPNSADLPELNSHCQLRSYELGLIQYVWNVEIAPLLRITVSRSEQQRETSKYPQTKDTIKSRPFLVKVVAAIGIMQTGIAI